MPSHDQIAPLVRGPRRLSVLAGMLMTLLLLAGCSGPAPTDPDADRTPTEGGAFPVTITHAHGTVTIPERPQRVVALGSADIQIARALDAPLVGVAENPSAEDRQWPGVDPQIDSSTEFLSSTEPSVEQIAALDPDLILITTAQPTYPEVYDQLSAIAPVVSYQKGLLEDSGEDLVRLIGSALGEDDRAEQLITDSAVALADWAEAHPEFAGQSLAFGQYVAGQTYLVVSPTAPFTTFLTGIGMELPDEVAALPVQAPPGITVVAGENLGVLAEADHVILGTASDSESDAFRDSPVVKNLPATRAGSVHFISFTVASLLLTPNPATTSAVLDELDRLLG